MPKTIPDCPAEVPKGIERGKSYGIELITPLFGGGVEAGENDATMPIRATSIRGQLQFWWRATRGQMFPTPQAMWRRQEEVFGSAEFPSPLEVIVSKVDRVASVDSVKDFQRFGPEAYALFPAIDKRSTLLKEGLTFNLALHWPNADKLKAMRAAQNKRLVGAGNTPLPDAIDDLTPDITAAMWAWVNFGGMGARTRRGCGALRCRDFAPAKAEQLRDWFTRGVSAHLGSNDDRGREWPLLPPAVYARPEARSALEAWHFILSEWKYFRQGEGFARNSVQGQPRRPGRSRYPEPETIRETLQAIRHRPSRHPRLKDIPADAYPRAELGLPIVFHFQSGEYPDTTLHPVVGGERKERMASPLILKPLALAEGGAVPLIVPLITPGVSEVELMQGKRSWGRRGIEAIRDRRLAVPPSPLAGLSPQGSALEAFLNFARRPANEGGSGFMEISR